MADIAHKNDKFKWPWAGHIARRTVDLWGPKGMFWSGGRVPEGTAWGRLPTRCADELMKVAGTRWMQGLCPAVDVFRLI